MMKEIYRLEQGNNKLYLPSKLSSNYSNIPSYRLKEEKIKNEEQCYIKVEDRNNIEKNSSSCCINCKDCFSYFFIYIEKVKSFCCSPYLYIISPWKWQCSILQEIIECDKKENK